jgi:hypothetical protein
MERTTHISKSHHKILQYYKVLSVCNIKKWYVRVSQNIIHTSCNQWRQCTDTMQVMDSKPLSWEKLHKATYWWCITQFLQVQEDEFTQHENN